MTNRDEISVSSQRSALECMERNIPSRTPAQQATTRFTASFSILVSAARSACLVPEPAPFSAPDVPYPVPGLQPGLPPAVVDDGTDAVVNHSTRVAPTTFRCRHLRPSATRNVPRPDEIRIVQRTRPVERRPTDQCDRAHWPGRALQIGRMSERRLTGWVLAPSPTHGCAGD